MTHGLSRILLHPAVILSLHTMVAVKSCFYKMKNCVEEDLKHAKTGYANAEMER